MRWCSEGCNEAVVPRQQVAKIFLLLEVAVIVVEFEEIPHAAGTYLVEATRAVLHTDSAAALQLMIEGETFFHMVRAAGGRAGALPRLKRA